MCSVYMYPYLECTISLPILIYLGKLKLVVFLSFQFNLSFSPCIITVNLFFSQLNALDYTKLRG